MDGVAVIVIASSTAPNAPLLALTEFTLSLSFSGPIGEVGARDISERIPTGLSSLELAS